MTSADSTSRPALLANDTAGAVRAVGDVTSSAVSTSLDLQALFAAHYASIWRLLRRLGIRDDQLDDASQEVFWVAARRLEAIRAGSEHAFLYGVALRVASDSRRRRNAQPPVHAYEQVESLVAEGVNPEEDLERRRARQMLDLILDGLPLELRTVFVLFELEGMSLKDIASLEDLPQGTVSSRLRRAREEFAAASRRVRAALAHRGER